MRTIEEAVESVRQFERQREAEGYADDTKTVLQRVPLMEYDGPEGLGFNLKAGVDSLPGKGWCGNGTWELALRDRDVDYVGSTPEAAIAAALSGVCRLGRDGSIDPERPSEPGAPPIQHCLNVLGRRLEWHLERRQETLRDRDRAAFARGERTGAQFTGTEAAEKHEAARQATDVEFGPLLDQHGNAIAALGTAIAALGRIKDR